MLIELKVVPSEVELKARETQAFSAVDADGKPVAGITWSLAPDKDGSLDSNGVYSAPKRFLRARRVTILARKEESGAETARASAVVNLDPSHAWIPIMGVGYITLLTALIFGVLLFWPELCPKCQPPGVVVSPPMVTLTKGQAQQFTANAPVSWASTVNQAGLYVAPAAIESDQTTTVSVTATSRSNPEYSGVGVVRLHPTAGLTVLPSSVRLKPGETKQFVASVHGAPDVTAVWLSPVQKDGSFTAPQENKPQTIVVLAQAQPAKGPPLIAGALVSVVPSPPDTCDVPGSTFWRLITLVAALGALGGLTHGMSSFGIYVGNRELKTSWLWWYALKPWLSAAVAVIVFLVFRAGLGTPDLGLAAEECLTVAGFAGLVGLFAEPATVKLKDIFDVLFTPRRDPREDKAGETRTGPGLPQIASIEPSTIKVGQTKSIRITGQAFSKDCVVRIGNEQARTKQISATTLEVEVPGTLQPGKPAVVVFNKPPDGEASRPVTITVEA